MTENNKLAHCLESKVRTNDVLVKENVSFSSLLLPENILKGLADSGFQKPSPIQIKALPVGRCGFDLTVKSKSGTGKTLVFGIIALETIKLQKVVPQALILVPTREIAIQIEDVLKNIGKYLEGLNIQSFIGGLPLSADKIKCTSCHIAVGSPGRVKQLIQEGHLAVDSIRLFVLDEADKLMEDTFQNDINQIYNSLPDKKQAIMCSATYPNELQSFLNNYMLSPTLVSAELETPLLLGLKQFVRIPTSSPNVVQQTKVKNEELLKILSTVSFTQCLVFSNYQTRAESISNFLNRNGWNSTFISGAQNQIERLSSLSSLKDFKCKILISTDLTSRGIDAANVDLVINYDIPVDAMTYLHRMGRAGRYGSTGNCINLALVGPETKLLQNILGIIGGQNLSMPILDDNLNMEETISKTNLLFAEVPDNIQEYTDKCKIEIIEMKNKTAKKSKKKSKNNRKVFMPGDEGTVKKVVEQKLSDVDISLVLEQFASGTFQMDTNVDGDDDDNGIDTKTNDFYNELLPSPLKSDHLRGDCKFGSEENSVQMVGNLDSISILEQLATDSTIIEVNTEQSEEKKRKRSENSADSQSEETLKKGESNEDILCKNKALFSVAKSLSNMEMCGEDTDYLTAYLGMLKAKERAEAADVLKNKEIIDINDEVNMAENSTKEEYTGVLENIFLLAYKYQVMNSSDKWQDHLPEPEKKKLEDNYIAEKDKNRDYDLLGEETSDEYEGEYEDGDYDEDYDFDVEKGIEVNFGEGMSHDASQDPTDYSFMQWIPVESASIEQKQNEKTCLDSKTPLSEQASSISSTRKIDIFNHPTTAVRAPSDNSYHEQYNQFYQHCSNNLWQSGLSFNTVQNFDEWFCYDWQNQVAAVRNFIQKKIYVEEMRLYQEEHNK